MSAQKDVGMNELQAEIMNSAKSGKGEGENLGSDPGLKQRWLNYTCFLYHHRDIDSVLYKHQTGIITTTPQCLR